MSKARAARRLAAAAAFGGGGLGLIGGSLYGVLRAEASLARRKIGNAVGKPPDPTGLYGAHLPGTAIRLAVLGDSGAAGYGADIPEETFGAFLAAGLSELAQRPVFLDSVARVGARTADLEQQIPLALASVPDICAMIIGTNDVTHGVMPSASVRALQVAVGTLRFAGAEVVVGTCPDLGTLRPVAPPLRQVARHWSRRLAAAQTIATVEAGGRSVSLGSILGIEFDASPVDFFGPDQFHPSPAGYRSCAQAMLPTVAAAIGVTEPADSPEPSRGEGVLALATAAAEAADSAGTEVSGTTVSGREVGPRGRWALLRHRRRPEAPVVGNIEAQAIDPGPDEADTARGVPTGK
ncbi:MAG: SGNH/GDSL hydrolase family protein [Propionibacteriales bacterium]|nr:SGNH/GDSL hydrolase family protein [Propionibacteriales bacterium]